MIVSASRRTDIPACFSNWFFNRLQAGFWLVRNPYKPSQITTVMANDVDAIVFWTKNPEPMLDRLSNLGDIPYYFQFTVTSYAKDIERHLPTKSGSILNTFECLAKLIGPERIIWRYDPVFLNEKYNMAWHKHYFRKIAEILKGMSRRCVFSFIDMYDGIRGKGMRAPTMTEEKELAASFLVDATVNGFSLSSCAESLEMDGISHSACVDAELLSQIAGRKIGGDFKDPGQRGKCSCAKSVDIGAYGTCRNGCAYCYAMGKGAGGKHNPDSPLLFGELSTDEKKRFELLSRSVVLAKNRERQLSCTQGFFRF